MASVNSVVLLGSFTKDPEQRKTNNDKTVTSFSLAVDGYNENTSFFDIQCWGKTAEFVGQYLKKGNQVVVSGRLEQQVWEKDGQKHSRVIVVADNVQSVANAKPQDSHESEPDDELDASAIPF